MSRLGTCRYAHHVQHLETVPVHPHERREVIVDHEFYTCQWLAHAGALPPPIARMHGGFCINGDDCDRCERYEVPTINPTR